MSQIFIKEINPVMRQMGYCCGQKFTFTPSVQFCIGNPKKESHKRCVVARDQPYFLYEISKSSTGVDTTEAERLIYCEKCFGALRENGINLNENSPDPPKYIYSFNAKD
jgi:E1A/CREB-binding protein